MRFLNTILLLPCFLLSVNYSFSQSAGDTYSDITPVKTAVNAVDNEWQDYYFSKDGCRCVYGDEYFVSIRETDPQSKNLIVTLQGGGACWPGMTDCKPTAEPRDVLWAKRSTALNTMLGGDYNQLFMPYCDGSIYHGDATADYDNNGEADHWHWGIRNSTAGLELTAKKYPQVEKIILTGCSAGGFGTFQNVKILRRLYPEARIYIINESGQGFFNPDTETANLIYKTWNAEKLLPEVPCDTCDSQLIFSYLDLLRDPKIKAALFSSYYDEVIGQQFLKMEPENFKDLLLATSNRIHQTHPESFKRYFINGKSHCVRDMDYKVNGMSYLEWVLAFVNDREGWVDTLEEEQMGKGDE